MDDNRLHAPAAERNKDAILDVLKSRIATVQPQILEIASGTGQHVAHFAASWPESRWWPSDVQPDHIASIDAWTRYRNAGNVAAARIVDVTSLTWADGEPLKGWPAKFDAILTANIVHIAPWSTTEGLIKGAAYRLTANGGLFIYGPFKRDGRHTAPSNEAFDHSLRLQDPSWGIRDTGALEDIAARCGLQLIDIVEMPANNLTLVFEG